MGRNFGRIGGALAGIVAVILGLIDVFDKLPKWLLIGLGVAAIVGVLLDYFWPRSADGADPLRIKQSQTGGTASTLLQAGRDITYNEKPDEDRK